MTKWISILFALAGTVLALYTVATVGSDAPPKPPPAAPPAVNPFPRGIAASGSIEAASRNIALAAPESGLVVEVLAQVGDAVKAGQPLLRMDARLLEADLLKARAALAAAQARLAELLAQPRAEELPPLQAAVDRARVRLLDAEDQFGEVMGAKTMGGVSPTEVNRRKFNADAARADLTQAQAQLALVKAGAWGPALDVARAGVAQAAAEIESLQAKLDRLTVRAPVAGVLLKRNAEPGEFLSGGSRTAALVLGDLSALHVRARVDEEDLPLLRPGAEGIARVRGVEPDDLALAMLRIEPLAVPKNDLMGTTTERVDTRVVEVLFRVTGRPRNPIYPGQAVDVFIRVPDPAAPPPAGPTDSAAPARPAGTG